MPRDARKYLWDALEATSLAMKFVEDKNFAEYQSDALLRSGVERQFEIIGEALKQLSRVDAELASGIPDLGRIVAFRNVLIHGYATVDDVLVWEAATHRLPALQVVLRRLLDVGSD